MKGTPPAEKRLNDFIGRFDPKQRPRRRPAR